MRLAVDCLYLLWRINRAAGNSSVRWSATDRICGELFRQFEQRLTPTMRQDHVAGDKMFVDNPRREAELFIGVLGASTYTYVKARWSQALPD